MRTGIAIKVKIGLRPNGHADHPDWTRLPLAASGRSKVAKEALVSDNQIVKWRYDKLYGHTDEGPDSPVGMQWGLMVVTQKFADEAEIEFPGLIFRLNDVEARDFWENRHFVRQASERIESETLINLKARRDLMSDLRQNTTAIDVQIARALDPDDNEPGVRRQMEKTWSGAKTKLGFDIV